MSYLVFSCFQMQIYDIISKKEEKRDKIWWNGKECIYLQSKDV